MANEKKIEVGALNVKLHPHSPKAYVDLLRASANLERIVKQRGERSAMIGSLHAIEEKRPLEGLYGQLYSFVHFDKDDAWLNTATKKAAAEHDLEAVQVPDHLKPGFRRYYFVLLPKQHRLFFETQNSDGHTFGPTVAMGVFNRLLNAETLTKRFGVAEVIIEPQREALERILKMYRLDWLELFISRPNADDAGGKTEREVLSRLEAQNANSLDTQLHAIKGQTIEPDDETKALAKIAQSNGYVSGRGRDSDGERHADSTRDHPLKQPVPYNERQQSALSALIQASRDLARRLTGK